MTDRMPEAQYANLKRVSIIANIIVGVIALLAIASTLNLLRLRANDQAQFACVRRIDLYVQDLRDDVNLAGWDSLVARAEGDTNQDVRAIAAEMRRNINGIKDARKMRHDAGVICEHNSDFIPPGG